ncbi:MAG: hypothetical protein JXR94_22710 [Candidatus Hydrogenedentes bacterium]|nr:hypothetical protein [Candidatus Hydrogenedentota bacterium]
MSCEATGLTNAVALPGENAVSARYLNVITRWIRYAIKANLYAPWPVRPDCGHFLGGLHWYGNETALPLFAIAAATASPDFDERHAGRSRDELRAMARCALRYLCFTHDTGPEDCLRPATGWNDRPAGNTKWGERGKGFFPESQCATTIAPMVLSAALLNDLLDDEDRAMLATVAADYIARFGTMAPKSGVYVDSQIEENAWTGLGLTGSLMLLPNQPDWDALWENAKRWTFCSCVTADDIVDPTPFDDAGSVADWTRFCCTVLPDGTVENHGIVHPFYAAAAISLTGLAESLVRVFGAAVPPHFHWRRPEIYAILKAWCDDFGIAHTVQGMDWPYVFLTTTCAGHALAATYLRDPDAGLLHERALRQLERSSEAHGGRCVPEEVARFCHDQQDCMIMRELGVWAAANAYLAFRLAEPACAPTEPGVFLESVRGVHVYPHGGTVLHVHDKGRTSLSWRNETMVLPATREGIRLVGCARGTLLARVAVRGKDASRKQVAFRLREDTDRVCALLIEDLAQCTVRRHVFFASLPTGKCFVHERLTALADITVEHVRQGYVSIMNDGLFAEHPDLRGRRRLYWQGNQAEFEGYASDSPDHDVTQPLAPSPWVNVDDKLGFVFETTGAAVYINRHRFVVWHAIEDDLILGLDDTPRDVPAGAEIAAMAVLCCPEQHHDDTAAHPPIRIDETDGLCTTRIDGFTCTWSFGPRPAAAIEGDG